MKPLWSPKQNGTDSVVTTVPGLLGIDHIGITVPNVDAAAAWFKDVLGCREPAHLRPLQPTRSGTSCTTSSTSTRARSSSRSGWCAAATARASSCSSTPRPTRITRSGRTPTGAATTSRSTSATSTRPSRTCRRRAWRSCSAPSPSAAALPPGRRSTTSQPPFGTYIELISYPHGMAYEATAHDPALGSARQPPIELSEVRAPPSSGGRRARAGTRGRPSACRRRRAAACRPPSRPRAWIIFSTGIRTVVSAGTVMAANGMSSKPTIGEVGGDGDAALEGRVQHPDREDVRRGRDRGRRLGQSQQCLEGRDAAAEACCGRAGCSPRGTSSALAAR